MYFEIVAIPYNTCLTTFAQLPKKISKCLLWNRSQSSCQSNFDGIHVPKACTFDGRLQAENRKKSAGACAAHIGSRSSACPNHRGRWWMVCAVFLLMPNSSAINLSVKPRSCASIFVEHSGVLLVDGRPERGSSSVVSFPSRKRLNHS